MATEYSGVEQAKLVICDNEKHYRRKEGVSDCFTLVKNPDEVRVGEECWFLDLEFSPHGYAAGYVKVGAVKEIRADGYAVFKNPQFTGSISTTPGVPNHNKTLAKLTDPGKLERLLAGDRDKILTDLNPVRL